MSSPFPTPDQKPVLNPIEPHAPAVEEAEPAASRIKFFQRRLPLFHNGIFWAATPAIALFALTVMSASRTLPSPVGLSTAAGYATSVISAQNWVVPASQTIRVSRQAAGDYIVLRGQLLAAGGDPIKSPTSGEVARVLVAPGQQVQVGQPIAMLTAGVAPAAVTSSPVDHYQTKAEAAQIAAARQQEKLDQRIGAANQEFERAKARVAAAQERVAKAREMIVRLQKGEEVFSDSSEESTPTRAATSPAARPGNGAAKAAAVRESQKLQAEAEAAESKAKAALKAARSAETVAMGKQQKLQAALAAAKAADRPQPTGRDEEKDGVDEKTPRVAAADNAAAARAVSAAREEANEAKARAGELRQEAVRLSTRATNARGKANTAARQATQELRIFDNDGDEPARQPEAPRQVRKSNGTGNRLTIAEAARIARAAMNESEAAIKDAERIRRRVESYGKPIESSRKRFEAASKQLLAAQQRMWNNAPVMRTNEKPLTATRSGVVTWVTAPFEIVKPGEAVAAVGRPDRLEVVVEDKTDAWKALKQDARVLALVQRRQPTGAAVAGTTPNTATTTASGGAASGGAVATPVAAARPSLDSAVSIPTMARVIGIAPPPNGKGVARVRLAVHNPPEQMGNNRNGLSPRAFKPGMPVFFSLAQPSRESAIRIPTSAVRRAENGRTMVAVLMPTADEAGTPSGGQTATRVAAQCRVEWREVQLAPGDGVSNRVKLGLEEGERIALRPDALYDFTLAYGTQATVSVEQI